MSDDNGAAAKTQGEGIHWTYPVRLFLLTFVVADILQDAVTVNAWAKFVLNRWSEVRRFVGDGVADALSSLFHVQFVTTRTDVLPLTIILLAVVGLGVARNVPLKWEKLGNWAPGIAGLITVVLWYFLRQPTGLPLSEQLGIADLLSLGVSMAIQFVVIFLFPRDLILATIAAILFLAFGMIDLSFLKALV